MDDKSKDRFLKDLINLRNLSFNKYPEPGLDKMFFFPENDFFIPGHVPKRSSNKRIPLFRPLKNNYPESVFDLFENDAYLNRRFMNKKFQHSSINAVFKNAQPAFESLEDFISTIKSSATALELMFISAYKLFYGVMGLTECFIWVKSILTKVCSITGLLKLVQWFLTKLGCLLKIVGNELTEVTADNTEPSEEMQPELDTSSTSDENEENVDVVF